MLAAEGRLTGPRRRRPPRHRTQALDRVTTGFRDLIERHGPESVAVLSTGQLVTEEFYTLGKLVRLGTFAHYDGKHRQHGVGGRRLQAQLRHRRTPGCYDDLALADVLVLWGANVADNHPLLMPRVRGRAARRASS